MLYIPQSGKSVWPNDGSWEFYWSTMSDFKYYDCFIFSSADISNVIFDRINRIEDVDIEQFRNQITEQQMYPPISMGCFGQSTIWQDSETNYKYLCIPQTGASIFFKLHEK